MKVIILYRVVQQWRAPIFEKLNFIKALKVEVWHGPDFSGTKVVSTTKEFLFKRIKLLSLKIRLNSKNGRILMPLSPLLFFRLIVSNPKVVVVEGASNIFNSLIAFAYCKIFRKKYIWWSLGKLQKRDYDAKRSKIDSFIRYIEKNADAIITYSSIGEDYYLGLGIDQRKIFKAVNVVDTNKVIENLEKNDKMNLIHYRSKYKFINLFVGALIKEKSIDKLLEAQKLIETEHPDAGLLIVGDGPYREDLEQIAKKLDLKNTEFLGRVVDENYKYFSIADLFTLPGLGGLAISEAMCYSLPIIASIGDGCEVDLVGDQNGIVDPNMTSEKLYEYILGFIADENKTKKYGEKSFEIIQNKYNVENYLNKIHDAIIN